MSYHRRRKGARRGPSPETIEAVPQWIVAPGGIGHAVRTRKPATTSYCGKTDFRGGFFTPRTPKRLCRECRTLLGFQATSPDPEPKPAPPPATQGNLF
jgi:hypothetical protein